MSLTVLAPIAGTVLLLSDVPDEVFAAGIVGAGCAIDPGDEPSVAIAPVAGKVVKVHPHAAVIEAAAERGVLFHLGINTVKLSGEGFDLRVEEKEVVDAGHEMVAWSPADVRAKNLSAISPVIGLQAPPDAIVPLVEPGSVVAAGDKLFTWL
ncbi:MAG: PTS glucose transporter subunit IIA [Micrococcales bacterium]|nr:PTS glucose transporter subunit IIA [Micrococcales bacterium]